MAERGCDFVGDSLDVIRAFPKEVRIAVGYALDVAQKGGKAASAKPMKGIGGGVFEIVDDHRGDTYRAVYAVRLGARVYVLHAFQKKSKSGVATPKREIDLIKARLKAVRDALGEDQE